MIVLFKRQNKFSILFDRPARTLTYFRLHLDHFSSSSHFFFQLFLFRNNTPEWRIKKRREKKRSFNILKLPNVIQKFVVQSSFFSFTNPLVRFFRDKRYRIRKIHITNILQNKNYRLDEQIAETLKLECHELKFWF